MKSHCLMDIVSILQDEKTNGRWMVMNVLTATELYT